MKFLSLIAIAVALVLGCGQDPSQEDSVPTAPVQQLPAPAPTPEPPAPVPPTAPLPPTPVPPTPAPSPPPDPTAVPAPTQPPASPSATPLALAGRLTQPTDSWLSEAIQSVPPDYGPTYLRFANYEAARIIADAEDFEGMPTMLAEGPDSLPWTYTLLFGDHSVSSYRGDVYDGTGIDFWIADTFIWTEPQTWTTPPTFPSPFLKVVTGVVDETGDLGDRLVKFDYQTANHGGTDYYYYWADKPPSYDMMRQSPFKSDVRRWNALAVVGDTLLARKWVNEMPELIDVHKGNLPSLHDDRGHRELAQAVGDELLVGAFLKPDFVADGWNDAGLKKDPYPKREETPPGRLASYSETWGTMEPYTVAVLGYSLLDGVGRNVIGLHYADREAAGRNADELTLRWNSSYLDIDSAGGSTRIGRTPMHQTEPDVHQLYTDICASFETRTVEYEKSSVLIGLCAPTDLNLPVVGADGDNLWWGMVYFHELHLLVPDPAELVR